MRLLALTGRRFQAAVTLVGLACILGIGVLDYLTGSEISFSVFYLAPVSLVAWFVGKRTGLLMSVCAALTWLAADWMPLHYSHPAIGYWNAVVRLGFFTIVSIILSNLKVAKHGLEGKVREKTAAIQSEIDEHKRTLQSLRDNEQQLRFLVESVKDYAFFMLDPSGCVLSWNEGAQRLSGYGADDIVGRLFSQLYPAEEIERGKPHQDMTLAMAQGTFKDEGWIVRKDGTRFWAITVLTTQRDEDGHLQGFANVIHDITNRKQLQDELLGIEEAERQRIGKDLHDTLGQDLTGIAFLVKELEERLESKSLVESSDAARIAEQVNEAIEGTASLARGLCAVGLNAEGLMNALRGLAANVEKVFGISCLFRCPKPVLIYDDGAALHLYRIAQEAINNAIKHGKAQRVVISLTATDDRSTLKIEDDGLGIPEQVPESGGMGLHIMDYRARSIAGSLTVERSRPSGTVVSCLFPAQAEHKRTKNGK